MITTKNYNRKCPHCKGKWFLYTIKGEVVGSILGIIGLRKPDIHIVCSRCRGGVQIPKKVIIRADRHDDIIIY